MNPSADKQSETAKSFIDKVKSEQRVPIVAPMSGWVVPLAEVPDAAFAGSLLGPGVALDPSNNVVCAPFDGEIISIAETCHAITIRHASGVEVLIHVGIDTVQLGGKGFYPKVEVGQKVASGEALLEIDLDFLAESAKSVITPIILLNDGGCVVDHSQQTGPIQTGQRLALFAIRQSEDFGTGSSTDNGYEEVYEGRVTLPMATGIHARPAAQIAKCAMAYEVGVTLTFGQKNASAKSLSSIMGLGAKHGDELLVRGEGAEAKIAVEALIKLISEGAGDPTKPLPTNKTAKLTESQNTKVSSKIEKRTEISGVSVSPGLGKGEVAYYANAIEVDQSAGADPYVELDKLSTALNDVKHYLLDGTGEVTEEVREIRAAHAALMDDPALVDDARQAIAHGANAQNAWYQTAQEKAVEFRSMSDPLLKERAADFTDIGRYVVEQLQGKLGKKIDAQFKDKIILADDLTPSQLLTLSEAGISGFATAKGGRTSHVAIIAASMNLPAIVAIGDKLSEIGSDTPAILDATRGVLLMFPTDEDQIELSARDKNRTQFREKAFSVRNQPARTQDGFEVEVFANLASSDDSEKAVANGAQGCGLLRTEFLFLEGADAPTEDQQLEEYQKIADTLGDRPLVIRTMDIGGDKPIPYLPLPEEENPALGLRGVRTSFHREDLFRTQLRALCRVKHSSPVQIMLPMITTNSEISKVKVILSEIQSDLSHPTEVKLGVMVETPASAVLADCIAQKADFMSIGTNDLTQYTLAMDRGNPALAKDLDAWHPSVFNLIKMTALAGRRHGKWVGICGGLASDIAAIPILVGLGVTELSGTITNVPLVKEVIRMHTMKECEDLAEKVLQFATPTEVRHEVATRMPYLKDWM